MNLPGFDRFVWATGFIGHILLLLVLFFRGRAKAFPVFAAYILENTLITVIRFFAFYDTSHHTYYITYWVLDALDEAFQLLVFWELATKVFCPTGIWALDVRRTFAFLMASSAIVAFFLTWLAQPAETTRMATLLVRSNFFSAALMSELLIGILVLSSTSGLPMKTYVARIAQGLGAYSIACVIRDIVINYVGAAQHKELYTRLGHARGIVYITCEVFWIITLWQEAPAPRELPDRMRTQMVNLHRQLEHDLMRIRSWRRN